MMRNQEYYLRKDYFMGGTATSSKISGATNGNCDGGFEGKRDLSVKCKLGDDKSNTSPPTKLVVASRFVAFSADYHGPKRHPPKHN